MRARKTVLVVGASSGLGLAVATELAHAGHRVFAGARGFAGRESEGDGGFTRLALDVTDPRSIADAVQAVRDQAGAIDALVLCAARIVYGSCEDTTAEELIQLLDTNLLGMVRVTQAVLPGMRARGEGLIVPFSSINGLLATPFTGAYVASKHAVEGWAEALRMEVAPFGLRVCVVRPGDHKSGGAAYRQRAAASTPQSPYAAACARGVATIARDEAGGSDPARLARSVARIVGSKHPPAVRTVARADQRLAVWLHDLLPAWAFSRLLGWYYLGKEQRGREAPHDGNGIHRAAHRANGAGQDS